MMRSVVAFLFFVTLLSCSSVGTMYPLVNHDLSDEDSGVILFRTESLNRQGTLTGFSVEFENENGDVVIRNTLGRDGDLEAMDFAFRIPIGSYELKRVSFLNGVISPVKGGFKFSVDASKTKYIGTILRDWRLPKSPESYGEVIETKLYFRDDPCVLLADCYFEGQVVVVDEGEAAITKIKDSFPVLKDREVSIELMH